MKLILSGILLFSGVCLAHGEIEMIDCQSEDAKTLLKGVQSETHNVLNFEVAQNGKRLLGPTLVRLRLKDEKKDNLIVEKITVRFKKKGKAILRIPEIEKEFRPGSGKLNLKSPQLTADLNCTVKY